MTEARMGEAKEAEDAGFPVTCRAVVKHSVGLGLEEIDQRNIWKADAEAAEADGGAFAVGNFRGIFVAELVEGEGEFGGDLAGAGDGVFMGAKDAAEFSF